MSSAGGRDISGVNFEVKLEGEGDWWRRVGKDGSLPVLVAHWGGVSGKVGRGLGEVKVEHGRVVWIRVRWGGIEREAQFFVRCRRLIHKQMPHWMY